MLFCQQHIKPGGKKKPSHEGNQSNPQAHHTNGGPLARLLTLTREVATLGLRLLIPSIYLCFGSYAEVFVFSLSSSSLWMLTQVTHA